MITTTLKTKATSHVGRMGVLVLTGLFMTVASAMVTTATSSHTTAKTSFQLKYFNARGAAETIRLLFALGGEEYDDARFDITPGTMDSPSFKEAKANGELIMNMNRAPVLVVKGGTTMDDVDASPASTITTTTLGQSKAIERFLAKRYGLMGSSDLEAAQIDCITEHCRDIKDAQMRKRFSAFVRDRSDEDKARDQKEWFEVDLPRLLQAMETCICQETGGVKGYAVGATISLADVAIYSMLKEGFPTYRDATLAAAQGCRSILEIVEAVENNPRIAAWLKARPESVF